MKVRAALLSVFLFTAILPADAGEKLTLKVSPAVAFAPANLIVRAMVESDTHNRAIAISAESDGFYRSSEIQLDGDRAPRTSTFEFRSLPSGVYEVRASLIGDDGSQRALTRQEINIISSGR